MSDAVSHDAGAGSPRREHRAGRDRRFLVGLARACAGEGAPIVTLTSEVRDWLEARDLLGSFRIRIG